MKTIDITDIKTINVAEMIDLAENADKITGIINKYGFYIMLGSEENFINVRFKNVEDEITKRRLIKTLKEVNPIIHHEFGLI